MAGEAWTLDGLTLTSGNFTLLSLNVDPPPERRDWVTAADSETAALMRQPKHENRTITMRLRVAAQASMDTALDQVGALVTKLRKASQSPDGVALTWTPANSTRTRTFTVLAGQITGLPIALTDQGYSWLLQSPIVEVELSCKPYWLGTALATVTDAFASNSIADYTFDAGTAGNVTITGGVVDAVANLATENRFLHTASPYDVVSSQVTVKHTLGTTLTSYKAGVIAKRIDASNYIETYVDDTGAASRLRTDKVIATVRTNLVSTALTRLTVSTAYWVRVRLEGNVLVAEHWTSAPTVTGTPAATHTSTLAGGDATLFGSGVAGRAGIVWTPQQTAATLDDLEIAPNVAVSATPFVTSEVASVPGDVPALGTIIVTDGAAQSRRHVEWGLEGPLTYNSATSLLLDSDSFVTSGFAGFQATVAGAYDPNASGNNLVTAILTSSPVAVCGTGNLSHVGTFRVKARVFTNLGVQVRFSWRAGDGPLTTNDWVIAETESQWLELDLGPINIGTVLSGTQRWTGQIEGLGLGPSNGTLNVDYLEFIPTADGYGKARAAYSYSSGVVVGQDAFLITTAGNPLNARVAPSGGTWATSGDATDFVFNDNLRTAPADGIETIVRSTTAAESTGRFAILGSTSYADTQVDVKVRWSVLFDASVMALVARWTDSSNYLRLVVPGGLAQPTIEQVVAGSATTLATAPFVIAPSLTSVYAFRLIAYASGRVIGQILAEDATTVLAQMDAASTDIATGGTLASGKPGIRDRANSGTAFRRYTDFTVSTPAAEPIALYSGRNIQVRYDDAFRQDSSGTYVGRPPAYRGSRVLMPVGTSRVLVKARRNDIEASSDANVTDATQIQVLWTPRGLAVPR